MTAGLIPADEGSERLTVDREALIERWVENFGLDGPWDMRIAQQEAEHVAGLVDAAMEDAERRAEAYRQQVERLAGLLADGETKWAIRDVESRKVFDHFGGEEATRRVLASELPGRFEMVSRQVGPWVAVEGDR